MFGAITDKTKASRAINTLSRFSAREAKKIFELNTQIFYQLWPTVFYIEFLSAKHVPAQD